MNRFEEYITQHKNETNVTQNPRKPLQSGVGRTVGVNCQHLLVFTPQVKVCNSSALLVTRLLRTITQAVDVVTVKKRIFFAQQ